jgi:dihydrofolate reductase
MTALETRVVDDFSAFGRELRAASDRDTWIVGGGEIMAAFLAAGEVDLVRLTYERAAVSDAR